MRVVALITACALVAGCSESPQPVRIGAKAFTEQQVLAQILALLVRQSGGEAKVINCVDSYGCQQQLREGSLDLMVEYTGTGLQFAGSPAPDTAKPLEQVAALYKPLGLTWLTPLGFDNSYALYVSQARAAADNLKTIEDLARLPGALHITCPPEFVPRPGDGLYALARRYGLKLGAPLLIEDPAERYRAVMAGQAVVAVGYTTDGVLSGLKLSPLKDSLGFFPPYNAAVVANSAALERPGLANIAASVAGRIDAATMQAMNYGVDVERQKPATVARSFLVEAGIIGRGGSDGSGRKAIVVTGHAEDEHGGTPAALGAVRAVFPQHVVRFEATLDPIASVVDGSARLALLGSERFFDDDGLRETRVEAAAVVGTRQVHVVRRDPGAPMDGRIGVQSAGSGAGLIGTAMLAAAGQTPAATADAAALLKQVSSGALDGAILLAPVGLADITTALASGGLQLKSLAGWLTAERAIGLPYLRVTRIPSGTYPGQTGPVDTLGAQVVLAGPARGGPAIEGGQAAAVQSPRALTRKQVRALVQAAGSGEAPNPALPSAWSVSAADTVTASWAANPIADTVLNLLTVLFLIWWFRAVIRRQT